MAGAWRGGLASSVSMAGEEKAWAAARACTASERRSWCRVALRDLILQGDLMRLTKTLLAAFVLIELGTAVGFADWPQWRGPNRDGTAVAGPLATSWGPTGPPVVWRRDVGVGFSSVAIYGGRLYTQWAENGRSFVVCLDAADGKGVWRVDGGEAFPAWTSAWDDARQATLDGLARAALGPTCFSELLAEIEWHYLGRPEALPFGLGDEDRVRWLDAWIMRGHALEDLEREEDPAVKADAEERLGRQDAILATLRERARANRTPDLEDSRFFSNRRSDLEQLPGEAQL